MADRGVVVSAGSVIWEGGVEGVGVGFAGAAVVLMILSMDGRFSRRICPGGSGSFGEVLDKSLVCWARSPLLFDVAALGADTRSTVLKEATLPRLSSPLPTPT